MVDRRAFAPGFRFSILDGCVLVLGVVGASGAWFVWPVMAGVVLFVVGHFFLFCNVLRMGRGLELAWAGVFCGLAGMAIAVGMPSWGVVFGVACEVTVVVAVVQMRREDYHGVGWRRVNPGLREWWERRE